MLAAFVWPLDHFLVCFRFTFKISNLKWFKISRYLNVFEGLELVILEGTVTCKYWQISCLPGSGSAWNKRRFETMVVFLFQFSFFDKIFARLLAGAANFNPFVAEYPFGQKLVFAFSTDYFSVRVRSVKISWFFRRVWRRGKLALENLGHWGGQWPVGGHFTEWLQVGYLQGLSNEMNLAFDDMYC